ncbi:cell division transport system permease protein [Mobilisporobacter senegalensis]|uniref:Cell division protein FtsX n=1 Tax=Mobilisporobacter senegalensis TaxID=1329262 RepID=A0A3N1XYG2_9FIRM|nr:permease-like cell division protein FtsX [Mobilisporobacter senegalensis]ROR31643.1 cell division transport system permease protein [Mobilisporobacter senegalensis]
MKIRTLTYAIKQGLKNIKRNRMFSLASVGTIMACLFLFGIFYFIIVNFQHMIKTAETSVGVTVFFDEGISQEQITLIGDKIKERTEVSKINFISAEEAWENFKDEYFKGEEDLTDTFADDNPLADSASYEIYLNDVSMQPSLVKYVNAIDGVRQVNSSDTTATSLSNINILVGYISVAIIIILIAVSVFLISTTVTMGISVRKDEISIMKLIGATDFFIRSPFIVEGIIIGLIGATLPLIGLYFIYNKAISYISEKFNVLSGILSFLDVNNVFSTLIPISMLIGVGIGFFGSFLTVRKHLRV